METHIKRDSRPEKKARNQPGQENTQHSPTGLSDITNSSREMQAERHAPKVHDSWYNPHNPIKFTLQVFEHELNVIAPDPIHSPTPPPKRKKNDIKRFSRKSRLRVLRKFNQLSTSVLSTPIFITLTTRHDSMKPEDFRHYFQKSFLPSLKNIIPDLVYAWRLEPHQDGYPHIHMFAWSWNEESNLASQYYKRQIRDAWSEAMGDFSPAFRRYSTKVKRVGSHRKAMSYVSKYVAKEQAPDDDQLVGRRWAVSTNFPASPITEVYLSRSQAEKLKKIAKRLLKNKGGYYEKAAKNLDEYKNWFLWLSLDEIKWLLIQIGHSPGANAIDRYLATGDSEDYSQEIEELSARYPGRC